MKNLFKLIISLVISLSAGFIGSFFTVPNIKSWYVLLNKPVYTPPDKVVAPVWTFSFILMGIALFLIWTSRKKEKKFFVFLFITQLIFNTLWSVLFFGLHNPVIGFIDIVILWFAVLICIISFRKISVPASWLFVPYFLWVSFASYLNFMIIKLN
jgi:tryptophan-rich sensory protein